MTIDEHHELEPDERTAFDRLCRERVPSELLEERTVQALKARGLLGGRRWPLRAVHIGAGLAAALALFASGVAVGQWLGSRAATESFAAGREQTALETAASVQRAGSAYVMALSALAQLADSGENGAVRQGREAAATALYAAAREFAQFEQDDPVVMLVREALARALALERGTPPTEVRSLVWF
jgi:hypothetical protein